MPRGRPGRSQFVQPSAGIKHEGSLLKLGYNLEEGEEKRDAALDKAEYKFGYAKTIQKLNALAVLNKHHPETHRKLERDMATLRRTHKFSEASVRELDRSPLR